MAERRDQLEVPSLACPRKEKGNGSQWALQLIDLHGDLTEGFYGAWGHKKGHELGDLVRGLEAEAVEGGSGEDSQGTSCAG